MLFNSVEFILFLPTVFVLYWFAFRQNLRQQNLVILVSSYVFYGWWDYRFLSLIFLSTLVDYFTARKIAAQHDPVARKWLLGASVLFNLGLLGFFKYYNFFVESWVDLFRSVGYEITSVWTLHIILPVGISFYTFQTMSYTIDVYRKQLEPTRDFISFASFVSFFPQLVAGPIERASQLLPQILSPRTFRYEQGVQGVRLILWGMFKKVVVADSLAPVVEEIFGNYQTYDGGVLWLGAVYFAFQIYCDFSGYSDIAIGTSKLFGFELMSNFRFPYFSRNIGEFWKRWHVSLSSWFRDYLYIPLGGSRDGRWKSLRNIFVIFLVSGFWHGANWTFTWWGMIHACLYLPTFLVKANRKYVRSVVAENTWLPSLQDSARIGITFLLVTVAWVFFRSPDLSASLAYVAGMFSDLGLPDHHRFHVAYILALLLFEWQFRTDERQVLAFRHPVLRHAVYLILFVATVHHFQTNRVADFIYFQF
ncbi:MAG: hypothetical protein RLY31_3012 [Bacteroidota bacterium]|jgi:D-alanyl-lipoteichoic acid acyltransferase DltB (MBOAT superfamily)